MNLKPRSRTPEPKTIRDDAVSTIVRNKTSRSCVKSENDLSTQRKPLKPKDTLTKQDRLALSYNAYLQSCLMALHDTEVRERKEQEVINIMENQQLELMALDEENNYLDMVLMKIQLFKQMKEDMQRKIELCQQIIDSTNEQELDNRIKTIEDDVTKLLLKNFKFPETNEDKGAVVNLLRKIEELLNVIPEIKKKVQPLNDVRSSLNKAEELSDGIEKLKKESLRKLKLAENLLYDELYLRTKLGEPKEWNVADNEGTPTQLSSG